MYPTKCILYADDTTFVMPGSNVNDLTAFSNSNIEKSQVWFQANKLKLNSEKTQSLIISTNNRWVYGNFVNLLGIRIDDKLNWACHVNMATSKLSGITFLLRRLKLHFDVLRMSYFALFHSELCYGIVLWGNNSSD